MKYGHLIAGVLFLVFLVLLAVFIINPPPAKKIGVNSGNSTPDVNSNTLPAYYNQPQFNATAKVIYSGTGFQPASLAILPGTTVIFENRASDPFWPASDPHPAHTAYPESGACGGISFDSCAPVPAGASWPMRFDKAGAWGYHDHLNPVMRGVIVVK